MPTERRTLLTPIEILPAEKRLIKMARPSTAQKHVRYTYLATELVDSVVRGGDPERSLVRDLRALDDAERKLTLEYAVKAMLTDRKQEVMAALAQQLERHEAAEKAAKAQQAAKTEALTRLATHARIRSKAKRVIKKAGRK